LIIFDVRRHIPIYVASFAHFSFILPSLVGVVELSPAFATVVAVAAGGYLDCSK
jgi:hypothetical protein